MTKAIALALLLGTQLFAPSPPPPLDTVLDRMGEYMLVYEKQLSEIVCDERYEQWEFFRDRIARQRRLQSEVAFLRLPGDGYWYGLRDTRTVDGRPVTGQGPRVADMISGSLDVVSQRLALMTTSSQYNLGLKRNSNMPMVPLEIIHPRNRNLMTFRISDTETMRGVKAAVVAFDEIGESTLISNTNDRAVKTKGRVWVEAAMGRIWRVEIVSSDTKSRASTTIRVNFGMEPRLGFLVPIEMDETFPTSNSQGDGRAVYSNFRKFQTSVRIVPQPQ